MTKVTSVDDKVSQKSDQTSKTRLVGFFVTFSADPMGQFFEIKKGRHILGSGDVADISIPGDDMMSSQHAILLYRRGKFLFNDNMSTNGSFVNGVEVEEKVQLGNYDEI